MSHITYFYMRTLTLHLTLTNIVGGTRDLVGEYGFLITISEMIFNTFEGHSYSGKLDRHRTVNILLLAFASLPLSDLER